MAAFDAGEEVKDLDFDFSKFAPGDPEAVGIIPEPSRDQINDFRDVLAKVYPTTVDDDGNDVLDIDEIRARNKEATGSLEVEISEGLGALCSNKPSAEFIEKMPWRVQRAFFGFIFGVFYSPEA